MEFIPSILGMLFISRPNAFAVIAIFALFARVLDIYTLRGKIL